ncbi:GNAT family N-acetyltransferase [Nostoc sp. CHAB 5715]|uniref:GNAT family N-acetyltransferase n=1 Tax=Nostoc sp. CHAB 5715 TaxID=2780400 RepID=UPI001E4485BF|nr:GNAT family N-acetyltransferase [Nostoc sp. CHAB 5715]MCC5622327.1 GNAT family N-acetyltransferase [Nostoc sp. CHAB 5715]
MDFQIRLSKPEDSDKVIKLQTSSLRTLSSSYDSIQIESLVCSQASARLAQDEIGVVAEHENDIVGFASLLVQSSQIAGVYVHPDFIRHGIGTQLLETVEKIAIDRGNEVAHVISSLETVNFYQAVGYKLVRKSGFYSEGTIWIPCINLEKQLISVSRAKRVYPHVVSLVSRLRAIFSFILFLVVAALVFSLLPLIVSLIVSLFR